MWHYGSLWMRVRFGSLLCHEDQGVTFDPSHPHPSLAQRVAKRGEMDPLSFLQYVTDLGGGTKAAFTHVK